MTSDADPLRPEPGRPGPSDPDDLPLAYLGRGRDDDGSDDSSDDGSDDIGDDDDGGRPAHTWWFVGGAAVIAVVGMVIGILVFNASAPKAARGAASAREAAQEYVVSINAGNLDGAVAIACTAFADVARGAARSGKDPGIRFTLDAVRPGSKTDATAIVTEHLKLPGSAQTHSNRISVLRSSGRWLVCGQQP